MDEEVAAMAFEATNPGLTEPVASVTVILVYAGLVAIRDRFSPSQSILSVKEQISGQVGLCPQDIQIIDAYPNPQQDSDGYGELLDEKTLYDYGITLSSKGEILYIARRVVNNDLIIPLKTFVSVVYLDLSVLKIPLIGSQTIGEFKILFGILLSCSDPSKLAIGDFYSNKLVLQDGGRTLDNKQLSEYGFITGSTGKILYVGINVPNYLSGTATIFYGNGLIQVNVPFDENETVLAFKKTVSQIIGIPWSEILILDYNQNPAQDSDDGIWQDSKPLKAYGVQNGELVQLMITRKGEQWIL